MKNKVNIAVIGLGHVGNYLFNELNTKKKDIEQKTGKRINVVAISAKNINKKRKFTSFYFIIYELELSMIQSESLMIVGKCPHIKKYQQ